MQAKEIPIIVLTGGPCGGKSTILPIAKQWLEDRGWLVGILNEAATELITGGFLPFGSWQDSLDFQKHLLEYQLEREERYLALLQDLGGDKPRVLLCDRGLLDSIAYIGRGEFLTVLRRSGHALNDLRSRYTSVIHLTSAARGAADFYTLANNSARSETPAQAATLDKLVEQAWLGHPHHAIIDNQTEFGAKVHRALSAFSRVLHIPEPLEIERKYLVRTYTVPDEHVAVEIEQTYLKATKEEPERRLRKRVLDGIASYFYTTKRATGTPGVRIEKERQLDLGEYERLLKERDTFSDPIHKTRYCFLHAGRLLELDVFKDKLAGLVLLEAEIADINDTVVLPATWQVEDVTGKTRYSNRSLAMNLFTQLTLPGLT